MTSALKGGTSPKVAEIQDAGAECARYSKLLQGAGFRHGFSLRGGGESVGEFRSLNLGRAIGDDPEAVRANHERFAKAVGYGPEELFEVSQVHGAAVRAIEPGDEPRRVRTEQADAIVTDSAGVAVGVRTADCVPLLIAEPRSGAVAAVHSGWRGTASGILGQAIDALLALSGAMPSDLLVAIGPHIRVQAFEVGHDVAVQIQALAPDKVVIHEAEPRPFACLTTVIRHQLTEAGVKNERVEDVGGCTFDDSSSYFSYRRDGGQTGRHLAAIVAR